MRSYFLFALLFAYVNADDTAALCATSEAQLSCGQCIKAHPDCAWCIDPQSSATSRCQLKSAFTPQTCTPHLVYAPQATQVKVIQDLPLEAKQRDGVTIVRLQPQSTSVRLMPGHSANVNFKYLHQIDKTRVQGDSELMEIQTSEFKDTPLKLKFFIVCEGSEKETKQCTVKNNQIVEFRIQATLESCSTNGDITVSVGVRGQRTIAALYVTAICGCECEKHPEMNSRLCHQYGHLVCGQCVCDATRGGDKCECPLALHGVSNALELEDKCRFNSSSPVCGSRGKCECGQCRCTSPTASGKFCQCDNTACPKDANGKLCSGNGVCDCGVCKCEHGWERDDCSCSSATNNCQENAMICSNHGRCECNRCVCEVGKTGAFCGTDEQQPPAATESEPTDAVVEETTEAPITDDEADKKLEEAADELDKAVQEKSNGAAGFGLVATFLLFLYVNLL